MKGKEKKIRGRFFFFFFFFFFVTKNLPHRVKKEKMTPRPASPHDSAASPPPAAASGKRSATAVPTPASKDATTRAAASEKRSTTPTMSTSKDKPSTLLPVKPRLRGKLHRGAAYAAAAAGASMVASASRVSAQAGWACLIYTCVVLLESRLETPERHEGKEDDASLTGVDGFFDQTATTPFSQPSLPLFLLLNPPPPQNPEHKTASRSSPCSPPRPPTTSPTGPRQPETGSRLEKKERDFCFIYFGVFRFSFSPRRSKNFFPVKTFFLSQKKNSHNTARRPRRDLPADRRDLRPALPARAAA